MATMIRLLPKGFATLPYRSSDGTVFVAVEGRGEIRVGDQWFAMEPRDIVVVPGWMTYTLHAGGDLVLFSYSDRVAQDGLGAKHAKHFAGHEGLETDNLACADQGPRRSGLAGRGH